MLNSSLSSDLKFITEKTINARRTLMQEYGSILTIEQIEYQTNDSRQISQCFKCHAFCFTNAVLCKCDINKVSCENHIKEVFLFSWLKQIVYELLL